MEATVAFGSSEIDEGTGGGGRRRRLPKKASEALEVSGDVWRLWAAHVPSVGEIWMF